METSRLLLWLLLALAVIQALVYYPQLPDVVASHFDAAGNADGWMSKEAFFAVDLGTVALTALLFLTLPRVRWPDRLINLPHKDYWLAPERREETFRTFQRQMLVFGCATLAFLLLVMQWAIEANLDGSQTLAPGPIWWLLGAYGLFTVVWLVRLLRHFYRIPRERPE